MACDAIRRDQKVRILIKIVKDLSKNKFLLVEKLKSNMHRNTIQTDVIPLNNVASVGQMDSSMAF
jgi:hypothetical protein